MSCHKSLAKEVYRKRIEGMTVGGKASRNQELSM